jgi:hypothetical protein
VCDRLEGDGSYGRMGQPVPYDGAQLVLVEVALDGGD